MSGEAVFVGSRIELIDHGLVQADARMHSNKVNADYRVCQFLRQLFFGHSAAAKSDALALELLDDVASLFVQSPGGDRAKPHQDHG